MKRRRKKNDLSPAAAKRQRAKLLAEIKRDLRGADRARLLALREDVRAARRDRASAIAHARATCKARRKLPTVKALALELRAAKAAARTQCAGEKARARGMKDAIARARELAAAEKKYQRDLRRIEGANRARAKEARGPGLARARERRGESDAEVRGNIPPELVALFDRVKSRIRATDRMTRTEAFLQYAHEHPDEEIAALESKADDLIAQYEVRARRANPGAARQWFALYPQKGGRRAHRGPFTTRARAAAWARQRGHADTVYVDLTPAPASRSKSSARGSRSARAPSARLARKPSIATPKKRAPKKPNAERAPAGWPSALIALARRRGARRVAFRPSPAWWARSELERFRTARRYVASDSRITRGMGLALARAERARGPVGAKKRNPPLVAVTYRERKPGDRKEHDYEHEFEGRLPTLRLEEGKAPRIVPSGSKTYVRDGWIRG